MKKIFLLRTFVFQWNILATLRSTVLLLCCFYCSVETTVAQQKTYCNPINIDYGYTPIPNFSEWGRHRATADPVIVNYKGDYYLFRPINGGIGGVRIC
jgi:hypothetical protein